MRLKYLFLLQLLTFPLWSQNQLSNTDFNNLSVEDGLSQNIVETIYQGSNGFLWLGTQDGLNRYDGRNFVSYSYKIDDSTSLSNNYIKDITEDANGNLLIGTYGGGLNIFDKKSKFRNFKKSNKEGNSISDNVVYSILKYSDSIYWLGTKNGLNRFNLDTETFSNKFWQPKKFPVLNNAVVYCLSGSNKENEIWVGTREGLNKINTDTYKVELYLKGDHGLTDDDIRDLFLDAKGTLWVATKYGGLFYKTIENNEFRQVDLKIKAGSNIYARKIYPHDKGGVWLGTFGYGLFYIDHDFKTKHHFESGKYDPNKLPSDNVVEIFKDSSSTYWLGTHGAGISYFNLDQKKFDLYQPDGSDPYSISDEAVNFIYEDSRGDIYIANDAGIDVVIDDGEDLKFKQLLDSESEQPDDRGWLIFEDSDQTLWIGMWNFGLSKYNRATGELTSYTNIEGDSTSITTNFVESMIEAPDGKLWLGLLGDGGVSVFDKETEEFKRYLHDPNKPSSLSNDRVHKIFLDSKNRIWLGTDFGLDLYQPKTDDFKHFRYDNSDSNSINYNIIRTLVEDTDHNIWVGTGGGGFARMIESGSNISFKSYTEEDGLANNNIAGISEDLNGNLWITTFKGLSLFKPITEEFKNYRKSDGLQGEEFVRRSIATISDGRLFMGGHNGLNVFRPKNIKVSTYEPYVNFVSIEIISESGDTTIRDFELDSLLLNHNDYILSFEVANTDFSSANKIEYAYKLEGFSKDWILNKNRGHFSFTSLPPGEYTLKIKSTNADGVWSSNVKELYINVDPPFYATTWFRLLAFAFIVLLIVAYIQLRIRFLKKSKERLQLKVKERTFELEVANKDLIENQSLVLDQKEEISAQHQSIAQKNAIIQQQNDDLRMANNRLEETVGERTSELIEANYHLKISKAEFDTFFYRAAHDLKGPVSTILGLCYLAMKETDEESALFYFSKVNETADRMNNILFNLQKINKLKQEEVNIRSYNLRDLIIEAAVENIPDNEDWQQFINIELKAEEKEILTDAIHLKNVFSNLISNSIKFSKNAEKPIVNISFEKDNESYQIVFEDFGLGINPEVRDKIFNMFFVANEKRRGVGLGLYSVKLAISKLGGVISLDDDKGACFRIQLPIKSPKRYLSE